MNISTGIAIASTLLISSLASASTTYSAYGSTELEARQAVLNWANGRAASITCSRLQMGAPWQCTGRLLSTGGTIVRVSAYGYSETNGAANAVAAWQSRTGSSRVPSVSCDYIGIGPGWQCTAWGRI
ncbi:hypothetical protein [Pseudoalteromonas sp. NC201]|uniref:hypothetical protein n=1 Tax=Pseudoalteromonas sp. NC201 TaxID=1514074 RepID=UPI000C7D5CC4|nr:hypothetical protein [Pseudoalteromonas sp. NC201]AUJ70533.1 hypothetical protein PNC201_11280 [Pseudoalteromonas sp. NC201]